MHIESLSPERYKVETTRHPARLTSVRASRNTLFALPNRGNLPSDFPESLPHAYHQWLANLLSHTLLAAQGVSHPLDLSPLKDLPEEDAAYLLESLNTHKGRSLIGIDRLNNKAFESYLRALVRSALQDSTAPYHRAPPSPKLVPLLLGGLTWPKVAQQIDRLREVFGMDIDSQFSVGSATIGDMGLALTAVNLGNGCLYEHDGPEPGLMQLERRAAETIEEYTARLENAKEWKPLRTGGRFGVTQQRLRALDHNHSFAAVLLQGGLAPYIAVLQDRMQKYRAAASVRVMRLFAPDSPEMTELIYHELTEGRHMQYLQDTRITDATFRNAVRMVFSEPWVDLELYAPGDHSLLKQDVEVALARALIGMMHSGLAVMKKPPQLTGLQLLGMALLTGIPILQFLQFVVDDRSRRGECVLEEDGVDKIIEIIQFSELDALAGPELMNDLQKVRKLLHFSQTNLTGSVIAHRLRVGNRLLWDWSGRRSYHLEREGTDDGHDKLRFGYERGLDERD